MTNLEKRVKKAFCYRCPYKNMPALNECFRPCILNHDAEYVAKAARRFVEAEKEKK